MNLRTQNARAFSRHLVKTFSAVNATAGTGIAQAVEDAFVATKALVCVRNGGTAGFVRPKYIRLIPTVAPASGTNMSVAIAIDSGVTRVSSGGTAITGKNCDMSSAVATGVTFTIGALVTAAATANVRYVARSKPMTVIPVVGDNIILDFSGELASSGMLIVGTAARLITIPVPPIILGPSNEMLIHAWYASNAVTPASYEVEAVWEESKR